MKKTRQIIFLLSFLVVGRIMLDLTGCTHDDQILDEFVTGAPSFSETELVSVFTNTPPTIDGVIESMWDNAFPLKSRAVVPKIGNETVKETFYGYWGRAYNFSMRSMYDANNIYFLVEWDDNTESFDRETWYFNPTTKRWAQESRYPTFNGSGVMIRDGFYEDKIAFLWNVDNSVANWNSTTCYASCHTGLSAGDGIARHYTNGPNERIDMWHWKSVREGFYGTIDDQFQDNTQPNGRKTDPKTSGGDFVNRKTLTITGSETSVNVPKYVIPNRTYYYWITQEEIDNGTAKEITAVDSEGVLTYAGGTIDPNTDTDFLRDGARSGPKGIPSVHIGKKTGNNGDITGKFKFTGSGWVLEIQRKLNTGDTDKVDINFADLSDQYFGVGVFDNAAVAHAIKANLLLKFKK
jgi:hypothetical protein